jgi:iron complex outermembrane receptor protein
MSSKQNSQRNELLAQHAAGLAMVTGVVAGVQQNTAIAQDTTAEGMSEIIVTGSRIRRLDAETASPVQIVSSETIKDSGATTLGELLQKLPSVAGAAVNPAVNNGGGEGASSIELRGLGEERTLVLLNGRRYGALGRTTSAVDVNSIPVNMIERVEVLKQGAGAIYGSDAIGGVVNFITKTSMEGAEVSVDYGKSSESDGERKGIALSWGASNDSSNLVLGLNYNKQDEISAGDRAFSRNAIYFYGSVFEGGSSRTPTGRMYTDTQTAIDAGLDTLYGCGSVTRIAGTSGSSLDDYRCFVSGGTPNDLYNYQPLNLILTPQERTSIFVVGSHDITDDVEMYAELLYNRTTSGFQIAPLPFDSRSDQVLISADNIYNPFGIDFGTQVLDGNGDIRNPNATFRLEALGNRANSVETWQGQISGGLRGALFDTGWNWDLNLGYGRIDQDRKYQGYPFKSGFQNALGPSFIDTDGTPTCGTPAAPIRGCVPLNIFNLADENQVAALRSISAVYSDTYEYSQTQASLDLNGEIFQLPAGAVSGAIGASYGDKHGIFDTDFLTQSTAPLSSECLLARDTCTYDSDGSYDVTELYAEVLVPILTDAPFAKSLNATFGIRYSDYEDFGSTTNGSVKVDWRPIDDLLIRASYADTYRVPTIYDIYQAPVADAPTFTDPCVGLTAAQVADNPNLALACENVPQDGSFEQANSQIDGTQIGNSFLPGGKLDPEEGDAITIGFVYEPQFIRGLSFSIDWWRYTLDNLIQQADVNFSIAECVRSGSPLYCGFVERFSDGTIKQFLEPTINFGSFETSGLDFSADYTLPTTAFGDFRLGWDATYTDKYDSSAGPGTPAVKIAGTYDRQYGNYAKWRMQGRVGWAYSDFKAQVVVRWIDAIKLHDPDGSPFVCDGGTTPQCQDENGDGLLGDSPDLQIASQIYWDLAAGYTLAATNTEFQVGVNNLNDNQPPILYQNNVINANTDVETYDTIGRYFFASITQKF